MRPTQKNYETETETIPCSAVKMKHTDLCYSHMQFTSLDWSRSQSQSRSFWSRSHNRFLVSVSVLISVSHSLVSVLALVSLCSGLINKPASTFFKLDGIEYLTVNDNSILHQFNLCLDHGEHLHLTHGQLVFAVVDTDAAK